MQCYLPCGPENAQKVRAAYGDIVRATMQAGNITDAEISKAVETSIQRYRVGVKTNNYWLSALIKYQQYGLPSENILNYETRLKALTPDALTAAANKYLATENVVHALLMPQGE
jgi:predicted Zn-dependent peptidase